MRVRTAGFAVTGVALADKIIAVHDALDGAGLAHAFGGALALAWCTQRARGTIDIDVNVFVPATDAEVVLAALPGIVAHDDVDLQPRIGSGRDDRVARGQELIDVLALAEMFPARHARTLAFPRFS